MPEPSSDAFLSGQGVPVDLHEIETALTQLWGPAAERIGGPDLEHPTVTRVVLANLVVEGRPANAGRLQGVLDTVTERYPCRTILLHRTDDPDRQVTAEVSALCHLPAPGRPQVCSERIELRAGPHAVDLLPGAVRPLLEANLPFVLWWTDDPRNDESLFRDLAAESSRLILDLPDPGTDVAAIRLGLDPAINAYARDTAWFGLTRWRELIAQFFDPPCHQEALPRIDSVRIEARSPTFGPLPPRLAAWLAAWLAGQLGWKPEGSVTRSPGRLKATFTGPQGPIGVAIETTVDPAVETPQIAAATVTTRDADGPETFRVWRPSAQSVEVRIEIDSPAYCNLPRVVQDPELDHPRRVAAALEASRHDASFENALPHVLWLLDR